ncbi:hypothetical protein VTN77DRAFT_7363 [Rasamsonia byssochlamydoides]|uniref:uncharacterized protein n=1 Tax=Rasamsonia byssochlamydoides TaxID=89139 RepID=UPI003744991E
MRYGDIGFAACGYISCFIDIHCECCDDVVSWTASCVSDAIGRVTATSEFRISKHNSQSTTVLYQTTCRPWIGGHADVTSGNSMPTQPAHRERPRSRPHILDADRQTRSEFSLTRPTPSSSPVARLRRPQSDWSILLRKLSEPVHLVPTGK